jgi:hypothetical protein
VLKLRGARRRMKSKAGPGLEIVERGEPYREWLIPAAFISEFATVAPYDDAETLVVRLLLRAAFIIH